MALPGYLSSERFTLCRRPKRRRTHGMLHAISASEDLSQPPLRKMAEMIESVNSINLLPRTTKPKAAGPQDRNLQTRAA